MCRSWRTFSDTVEMAPVQVHQGPAPSPSRHRPRNLEGLRAAARIANRFQEMLRRKVHDPLEIFQVGSVGGGNAIDTINRFIEACRPQIEAEVAGLADESGRIR